MNSSDSSTIQLLVIEPSPNAAERHISTLRNAGLAVHHTCVSGESDVLDALQRTDLDLILYSADNAPNDFQNSVELCLKSQPDTPLIILYQDHDPGQLLQAMRDGARDVVCEDDPDHLQIVVKREFGDLQVRRQVQALTDRLRESDARCSALIDHSRDAIAYIHEGMHVRVNPVYLGRFGYVDMDELEGVPILDMIAPQDIDKFKRFLRTADTEPSELEVLCQNSDGETFQATLEFSPASIDGEPCTQIIIRDKANDKQLEQKLRLISNLDSSSRLNNRKRK